MSLLFAATRSKGGVQSKEQIVPFKRQQKRKTPEVSSHGGNHPGLNGLVGGEGGGNKKEKEKILCGLKKNSRTAGRPRGRKGSKEG